MLPETGQTTSPLPQQLPARLQLQTSFQATTTLSESVESHLCSLSSCLSIYSRNRAIESCLHLRRGLPVTCFQKLIFINYSLTMQCYLY